MVSKKLNFRIASQPLPISFGGWLTIFLLAFALFLAVEPSYNLCQAEAATTATTVPTATPQPTPTATPQPSPTPTSTGESGSRNPNGVLTLLIFVGVFIVGSILAVSVSMWRVGRRRR